MISHTTHNNRRNMQPTLKPRSIILHLRATLPIMLPLHDGGDNEEEEEEEAGEDDAGERSI